MNRNIKITVYVTFIFLCAILLCLVEMRVGASAANTAIKYDNYVYTINNVSIPINKMPKSIYRDIRIAACIYIICPSFGFILAAVLAFVTIFRFTSFGWTEYMIGAAANSIATVVPCAFSCFLIWKYTRLSPLEITLWDSLSRSFIDVLRQSIYIVIVTTIPALFWVTYILITIFGNSAALTVSM